MRPGGDQPAAAGVDARAESFECASSQERQIARLRENDLVHRFEIADAEDGVAGRARDALAVGHDEDQILLLDAHAGRAKLERGEPRELRACVHEQATDHGRLAPASDVSHLATDVKRAHARTIVVLAWAD